MLEMDNNKEFKILRLNKQEILKIWRLWHLRQL